MTDNIKCFSDQGMRYRTPQVAVVEMNVHGIICLSPTVSDWNNGSASEGDMEG